MQIKSVESRVLQLSHADITIEEKDGRKHEHFGQSSYCDEIVRKAAEIADSAGRFDAKHSPIDINGTGTISKLY